MKSTFYEVPTPLAVFGPDGTIEDANASWDAIFTGKLSDRTGAFASHLGEETYIRELERTREAFATGETLVSELVMNDGRDGPHFEVTRQLILSDAHTPPRVLAIFYDVSGYVWSYDELLLRLKRVKSARQRIARESLTLVREARAALDHFVEALTHDSHEGNGTRRYGANPARWAETLDARLGQLHRVMKRETEEKDPNSSEEN